MAIPLIGHVKASGDRELNLSGDEFNQGWNIWSGSTCF